MMAGATLPTTAKTPHLIAVPINPACSICNPIHMIGRVGGSIRQGLLLLVHV